MQKYIFYFLIGGTIITIITFLADIGHPLLSGTLAIMPTTTLVAMYFISQTSGDVAVVQFAKSSLYTIAIAWVPYILSIIYFAPKIGTPKALLISLAVFLILATLLTLANQSLHLV